MKLCDFRPAKNVFFTSALVVISLILLIDVKPSDATTTYDRCNKSVPEPYPFIGVLALGILGGGYLLKQRLKKKENSSTSNEQKSQQIAFIHSGEDNHHDVSPFFELQLIDPTEGI